MCMRDHFLSSIFKPDNQNQLKTVMITANARNLRMNLKPYLDGACERPIRILRGANQTFVFMNEEDVKSLNAKIETLQSQLVTALHKLNKTKVQTLQ